MNKRLKFAVVILAIFLHLNGTCDAGLISNLISYQKESKLPKFACDVIKDVVSKERESKTVTMAIFENNLDESEINKILKCLPKRLLLTITDFRFRKPVTVDNVKSSIVIMAVDTLDTVRITIFSQNVR